MSNKSWTHPEYKAVLATNLAGSVAVGQLLNGLSSDIDNQLSKDAAKRRSGSRLVMSFLMMTCCLSLLVTEFLFNSPRRLMLTSTAVESEAYSSLPVRSAGVVDKATFLAKVSASKLTKLASNAHYILALMTSTGKALGINDKHLAFAIVTESIKAGVDPLLVAAVIKSESTFNHKAISNKGAQGLMQLLPETGRFISEVADLDWKGSDTLHDPAYNIRLGIAYLQYLRNEFGWDLKHALIAYNWGPGNLQGALKRGSHIPTSTLSYAQKIMSTHERWRRELDNRMASNKTLAIDSILS